MDEDSTWVTIAVTVNKNSLSAVVVYMGLTYLAESMVQLYLVGP